MPTPQPENRLARLENQQKIQRQAALARAVETANESAWLRLVTIEDAARAAARNPRKWSSTDDPGRAAMIAEDLEDRFVEDGLLLQGIIEPLPPAPLSTCRSCRCLPGMTPTGRSSSTWPRRSSSPWAT